MLTSLYTGFSRLVNGPDAGRLLLRLTFGILMLFHGYAKTQHGVGWIADLLHGHDLPGFIAYGAYIGEIISSADDHLRIYDASGRVDLRL